MAIIRFSTRFCRHMTFRYNENSLIKPVECFECSPFSFHLDHIWNIVEKSGEGKKPEKVAKKPILRMPGLVHPETKNEESFISTRTKEQIEALKRGSIKQKKKVEPKDKKDK